MKLFNPLRVWPVPAFAVWALCWCLYMGVQAGIGSPWLALALASAVGALLAWPYGLRWRRMMVAGGFPLSMLLLYAGALPAWLWLVLAGLLLLLYPQRNWRDAPWFPTPIDAFAELPGHLPLPPGARVLDAGCGLGDGLLALRRAYPLARLVGIEWSAPLAWLARVRCGSCQILRGDMWQQSWRDFDLVYVFQRPESMPGVLEKARAELKPGAALLSLDFEVPGCSPWHVKRLEGRHGWYLYRQQDLQLQQICQD